MTVIKCKMCGGDLALTEGATVAECEYCGSQQTVPTADNEKKMTLFGRANRLRMACEFDKAAGVYESIVAEFPTEAEAYWGLVLCRYGIEYVDDPATGKKIPTCHRSSFDSIMDDSDFDQACENADAIARRVYREEAKVIEEIRKGILEVSGKEEPYDIFICYKETDESGSRTIDSVLAQEVYDALTEKGYRVFFSRITLEDKLGAEYEPYIFAALNSAKVMLAFGTDYDYFNAVWVKNEWSRFLGMIAAGQKKTLIPCYKNMDAYDMPKEFARLQGQDLGKVGAVQDLLRGIGKVLPRETAQTTTKETVIVQQSGVDVDALLKRGNMALEDKDWNKAKELFDQVLNQQPECAEAYLGMCMAELNLANWAAFEDAYLKALGDSVIGNKYFARAKQFAADDLAQQLTQLEQERARWEKKEKSLLPEKREKYTAAAGMIGCGSMFTVGLRSDGTVMAEGKDPYNLMDDVAEWHDIVAVAAGREQIVGLRSNGRVLLADIGRRGGFDMTDWHDVIAITAGDEHFVGLRSDGTVIVAGSNVFDRCDVSGWHDVTAIAAGYYHTVGLRSDGTVMATGDNENGQCDVSKWRDVVAIAAGAGNTVGLRSDGTVLDTEGDVSEWRNVVAIAAGAAKTVGLRSDGAVLVEDWDEDEEDDDFDDYGQSDVSGWRDIVAIAAGDYHIVGLRSDGSVLAAGDNEFGQRDVRKWKLFDNFDNLEQERKEALAHRAEEDKKKAAEKAAKEAKLKAEQEAKAAAEEAKRKAEQEAKRNALKAEQSALQTELAGLKGIFNALKRKQVEAKLAELEAELQKLK